MHEAHIRQEEMTPPLLAQAQGVDDVIAVDEQLAPRQADTPNGLSAYEAAHEGGRIDLDPVPLRVVAVTQVEALAGAPTQNPQGGAPKQTAMPEGVPARAIHLADPPIRVVDRRRGPVDTLQLLLHESS